MIPNPHDPDLPGPESSAPESCASKHWTRIKLISLTSKPLMVKYRHSL